MITPWNVDSYPIQEGLTDLPISCPNNQYLNKFQYMPSNTDPALSSKTRYSFTCCSYDAHTPPATDGDFHHVSKNGDCYMFAKDKTYSYSQMGSARQVLIYLDWTLMHVNQSN